MGFYQGLLGFTGFLTLSLSLSITPNWSIKRKEGDDDDETTVHATESSLVSPMKISTCFFVRIPSIFLSAPSGYPPPSPHTHTHTHTPRFVDYVTIRVVCEFVVVFFNCVSGVKSKSDKETKKKCLSSKKKKLRKNFFKENKSCSKHRRRQHRRPQHRQ